ncbi:PREDICTED: leucine-rich repeat and IQ domain-containing protein 3 [Hipposideros armiger]|uniref:Leucine-rich repeat and IQ domain-containing protein 3 n=1 Tax=Hipposideros armiger TaxID=186990 RepID=A0A8B7REQ5_HIPAR|nr:PREDICTED: leucine-rich repeat and IQ domain-containing protein 3 [Hipposideros armiger]
MFHGTITKELTSHEEWSHYTENVIEEQKDFVFVKFSGLHLKSMKNLQSSISLRICIFSNNFITDIRALQNCIKLIKLDLHGNQVKSLPDTKFWSGLKNLKLLYLHDNGIAKLKNICTLSACPSLIALTMFDCPVSLKTGYRHVLVNSIWTLKALDHHVISDEEIIQNWHLPERFKAYNQRLFFHFSPALKKGSTYEDEINNIKYVISKINVILAHNSPVLIVQRWIRGFLVRKSLSFLCLYKKHPQKFSNECQTQWIYIYKRYEDKLFKDVFFQPKTNKTGKLAHRKHKIHSPVDLENFSEQRKHVSSIAYELETKDIGIKSKKSRHLIQGQKSEDEIEDEELDASFRISVFKLPLRTSDSLRYPAVSKDKEQDSFPTYAQPFSTTHQKPVLEKKDTALEKTVRREFLTTHRTGIKLQTLCDIEKYHSEQKMQESREKKVMAITMAQVAQERVGLTVQETLNQKKYAARRRMAKDNEAIQNSLHQLWQDRSSYLEKVRERRALFLEEKSQKAKDRLLIQRLSNERTILTRGIVTFERLKNNEAILKEKHLIVRQKLEQEKYQKDLLKHMKHFRAQETYKRHCDEKFVIDMIAFQKACERLLDAKTKAAIVKANSGLKFPSGITE